MTNETPKIFESEYRFCLILWEQEPITAAALSKLCKERLDWSRTTTYTVIKRLGERGVLKNENGTVRSLITKAQVQAAELDELMDKTFENSLPAFLAAFAKHKGLSDSERADLLRMIDEWDEEGGQGS
ncbi:MAG: BlaI/MecI/CopY family transcriptional regulator [Clostridia bacterium]|nr:BlaI/MecI/CopY family transcriptional regulator [Clostridia bacterium]